MKKARKLTVEERRARHEACSLDLLRSILDPTDAPPLWSAWQASWYLIGIHIDSSFLGHGEQPSLFIWLPLGAKQFHSDAWHRETEVSELRHYVAGFCVGESKKPAEWINHALNKEHRPDWAEVAIRDPDCRRLLPNKLLVRLGGASNGEKRQVRAARIRHERDPRSQRIAALRGEFEAFLAQHPEGRLPDGLLTRWCVQMEETHGVNAQTLSNATGRWRKKAPDTSC